MWSKPADIARIIGEVATTAGAGAATTAGGAR
jgi:hypothetical protein